MIFRLLLISYKFHWFVTLSKTSLVFITNKYFFCNTINHWFRYKSVSRKGKFILQELINFEINKAKSKFRGLSGLLSYFIRISKFLQARRFLLKQGFLALDNSFVILLRLPKWAVVSLRGEVCKGRKKVRKRFSFKMMLIDWTFKWN